MKLPSISLANLSIVLLAGLLNINKLTAVVVATNRPTATNDSLPATNLTLKSDQSLSLDSSSSFYYDADAFLLNKQANKQPAEGVAEKSKDANKKQDQATKVPAAKQSARGGRMLNLDALVGEASNVEGRSMPLSGNRQSRKIGNDQHLELVNGKKLKIQGFIPIVGIADEETSGETNNEPMQSSASHKFISQQPQPKELPFGQSSPGHASYGVQRYLNTEPAEQQNMLNLMQQQQQILMQQQLQHQQQMPQQAQMQPMHQIQPEDAKYSGAIKNGGIMVVDALKKPIKKLTSTFSSSNAPADVQAQQNCLCVPFYICKNGHLSESSLSRSQLQQLIAMQNQPQQQPRQLVESAAPNHQAVRDFVDSSPLIDERSFDKSASGQLEIVTARSTLVDQGAEEVLSNTSSLNAADLSSGSQDSSVNTSVIDQQTAGSPNTTISEQNDYTQDILGRMLGLKAPQLTRSGNGQQQQVGGQCGLLRTCCQVPARVQLANADLFSSASVNNAVLQLQRQHAQEKPSLMQQQQQQQQMIAQRYPTQMPQTIYGMPSMAAPMVQTGANFMNRISSSDQNQATRMYPQQSMQMQQFQTPHHVGGQISQLTRAASFVAPSVAAASALTTALQHNSAPQFNTVYGGQSSSSQKQLAAGRLGTRRLLEGRCGLRHANGITGRVQNLNYQESSADFGEYPAQAAILKRLNGSESLFVCAGTLISQQWVATAAHCIRKHSMGELKVRLGEWDVHRDDEFYPHIESEVRDLVVHPEFMSGNLVNDVALIRLRDPVDPSLPHINPACLPTIDESFRAQRCWVTGWGKDSFGQRGSFQSVLQEVELPVIGQPECELALRQTRLGPHYRLHAGFICAGGEGGRDACEGDGGSGLYCSGPAGSGEPIKVAGLVSWGIGCGQQGVPGVYVNLAHYRPWIESVISSDEDIYSPAQTNALATAVSTLVSERSNANEQTASQTSSGNSTEANSTGQDQTTSTTAGS